MELSLEREGASSWRHREPKEASSWIQREPHPGDIGSIILET
jgi:hypothetical protein